MWTKLCTKIILQTSVATVLYIFSKEIISNNTKMSKTNFENSYETQNFTCVSTISLNFETYFLEFLWEIVFGVISGNYLSL